MDKKYKINEIFYSLQGEGVRAGTANFFVRFTGCNLRCAVKPGPLSPGGFDCDTEFTSGRGLSAQEIYEECCRLDVHCESVIFTGGEPLLQLDEPLLALFKKKHFYTCVETNGTINPVPLVDAKLLDWVTLSPKVAEHALQCKECSEIKYVRAYGQDIPVTSVKSHYRLISPAFTGEGVDTETLAWCIKLVKAHPTWRLSLQQHKAWKIR